MKVPNSADSSPTVTTVSLNELRSCATVVMVLVRLLLTEAALSVVTLPTPFITEAVATFTAGAAGALTLATDATGAGVAA